MVEEKTVFEIEIDIEGADKQIRDLEKVKAEAVVPAGRPDTVRAKPKGKKTVEDVRRDPRRLSRLSRFRRDRERSRDIRRSDPEGAVTPRFLERTTAAIAKAVPVIGGAIALGFFAAYNAERFTFVKDLIPGGDALDPVFNLSRTLRSNIKGAFQTISDASNLAKAFGAIGEAPSGMEVADLIPDLFVANRAQAHFQMDITQSLYNSRASAALKTITGSTIGDTMDQIQKRFLQQSNK